MTASAPEEHQMRRTFKTVAAMSMALSAALIPLTTAQASDRSSGYSVATDPSADVAVTGTATTAQANAYDVVRFAARSRLHMDSSLLAEGIVTVNDTQFDIESRRLVVTFNVDAATDYTAVATVVGGAAKSSSLTVNGVSVSCSGIDQFTWAPSNRFGLSVPISCLPSGGTFTASARVVTVKKGGGGTTTDTTATTTSPSPLTYSRFHTGRMSESSGDVTFGAQPNAERGAGRSIDILSASAAYATTPNTARTTIKVLDLSTRRYHTKQTITATFRAGNDTTIGSITLAPDLTGANKHTLTTSGLTCPDAKVVTFNGRTDTVVIDAPVSCFGSIRATHVLASAAAYDASGVLLGSDTTSSSPLIALR